MREHVEGGRERCKGEQVLFSGHLFFSHVDRGSRCRPEVNFVKVVIVVRTAVEPILSR